MHSKIMSLQNRAGPSKIPIISGYGTLGQRGCRVTAKRGVVWGQYIKGASNALDRENQGIVHPLGYGREGSQRAT